MHNSNDLFGLLFRIVLKNTFAPNSSGNPNDHRAENELTLAALGLLAFVGADAMNVIYRKNFGSRGLSLFRVVLAFIAFLLISIGAFLFSNPEFEIDTRLGSHESYVLVSIFYLVLAFYVLAKGIKHKKVSSSLNINPDYTGDSSLLSGLIEKEGWSQKKVQIWAEPLLTLVAGGALAAINLLWGLPIIFCALSIWGHQIAGHLFGWNTVNKRIEKQGYRRSSDDYPHIHS